MNYKEIFEEYTQASNKVKYIKEKAKALGVYDSDIICELFKSGYKFEELKRANKATYNAGMKKYEKWKENGSPEDEEADALERTEPEQTQPAPAPSTRVDEENYKPEDYIAHLERVLKEQEEKMTELISTNQYLEDQKKNLDDEIERLSHEKCRLEAENRKLKIRVQELLERSETTLESTRVDEEYTYSMEQLMDENRQLKADLSQSKCAYDEMVRNYNDAMLMNKQLENQLALEKADNESESRNLKLAYRENEELRTKIQKCEAFIINQMVYVDHSDFGLKNCCLINLDFSKMTEDEKGKFFKSQRRERIIDQ